MNRREILRYTALFTGAAVSLPLISSLSSCSLESLTTGNDYAPIYFSKDEYQFIRNIADTILPETDSPSASAVGVPKIIDTMVGSVYTKEQQSDYKTPFDALMTSIGDGDINVEKLSQIFNNKDESLNAVKKGLTNLKQQTVAYYLSTEEIGTKYLNYLPVPGVYQECITLEEAGNKAWAI